jgi:pimeloyl-ACP methyl ester carboxylesterase
MALVNGINTHYMISGHGEPIMMINGLGASDKWKLQTPVFNKSFTVIEFDKRGSGKSDKPPGPNSAYMIAQDTVQLMDYLSIPKASILGYSFGGGITQEIAINYPQRVQKLILGSICPRGGHEHNGPIPTQ